MSFYLFLAYLHPYQKSSTPISASRRLFSTDSNFSSSLRSRASRRFCKHPALLRCVIPHCDIGRSSLQYFFRFSLAMRIKAWEDKHPWFRLSMKPSTYSSKISIPSSRNMIPCASAISTRWRNTLTTVRKSEVDRSSFPPQ